jgi:ParB/Sulfiredoxin domain
LIYGHRVGRNLEDAMVAIRRIERVLSIEDIKPNPNNARVHSNRQIGQIADSIKAFGFGAPVLVDETLTLIAGHGRLRAAELLGLKEIPAIELRGLSAARKRALALADNKIGDNAGWDRERLAIELPELSELLIEDGLDVGVTGFFAAELDQLQVDFEEEPARNAFTPALHSVHGPRPLAELTSLAISWSERLRQSGNSVDPSR